MKMQAVERIVFKECLRRGGSGGPGREARAKARDQRAILPATPICSDEMFKGRLGVLVRVADDVHCPASRGHDVRLWAPFAAETRRHRPEIVFDARRFGLSRPSETAAAIKWPLETRGNLPLILAVVPQQFARPWRPPSLAWPAWAAWTSSQPADGILVSWMGTRALCGI